MTYAQDLLEAMPDAVFLYRYIGDDDAGNENYAVAPITLRANITVEMRRGGIGDREATKTVETPVTGTIIVAGDEIRPRDKITFLGVTKQVDTIQNFRGVTPDETVQQITFDEEN